MCGIAGLVAFSPISEEALKGALLRMTEAVYHRGPDDGGTWVNVNCGIGFGHRRLSILDTSVYGRQPMQSPDNRFTITYNGEIYNYRELRVELESAGAVFRTRTDTEVMLEAFRRWGTEEALCRFVGMFAFALWDDKEKILILGRDRVGEKPLYYGWAGNSFVFASELKALRVLQNFESDLDRDAVALYLRHNYIPTPYSIYKNVRKLSSGSYLKVPISHGRPEIPDPVAYWSLSAITENAIRSPWQGSDSQAIDALDELLRQSIRGQMQSDVPLGTFLSGGTDSSLITALMQAQSPVPVQTFTIGFGEPTHNEAIYAKKVAHHLGTEHTELYVSSDQARDVIPLLPRIYDEPFSDSSQIPTYIVSQLARRRVTVALSGDGGDELFGGYDRYFQTERLWRGLKFLPTAFFGTRPVTSASSHFTRILDPLVPSNGKYRTLWDRVGKLGELVTIETRESLYREIISHWKHPATIVKNGHEPEEIFFSAMTVNGSPNIFDAMMACDFRLYLPDDILVKVDRAAMAVALETRTPILDHRIVEFAWKLPHHFKVRNGKGKWILRQLLHRYIPKELVERPKMGFGVPIENWLRGPLRDWAEDLLQERRLREEGIFDPKPIRQKWKEHTDGKRRWHYHLWDILMFQSWLTDSKHKAFIPAIN